MKLFVIDLGVNDTLCLFSVMAFDLGYLLLSKLSLLLVQINDIM